MIKYFAAHPTAANLLMIIFLVLGLFSLPKLNRETFPEFESSKVQVKVIYPGATAEEVEEAIVQRLEENLSGIQNVEETKAEAMEGVGLLILEMNEDSGDLEEFIDDIRAEVDAISNFPEAAKDPVITTLGRTSDVIALAVTGPMSVVDLKDYTEKLKRKILRLPEVSLAKISGFSDRQIRIQISAINLLNYGLNISDISDLIAQQSVNIPIGSIESEEKEILLRFKDERKTVETFKNIIILGGEKGAEIKLGDVATIEELFEDPENKTLFNGERAGVITISKTDAEDSLIIYDAVKAFIENEQLNSAPGVKLTLTYDMASVIYKRLILLITNGWQGLLLVFIALFVFFSFRLSFWVTMGLPISFAGALFIMYQIGYTFNMMTTLAMVITLGLLMDDAIVIAENIARHLQMGKSALEASVDGVKEVQGGVISSFLTTACVFIPLAFMEGRMGRVMNVIPVVLLSVLAISLIEAFLILPNHLSHSMKRHSMDKPGKIRGKVSYGIEWIRENIVGKVVDRAVKFRYLTFGVVIMILLASAGMLANGKLKFQGFPSLEDDSMQARIYLPPGTALKQTEKTVQQVIEGLTKTNAFYSQKQKNKTSLIKEVRVSFSKNSDVKETGAHLATIYADLASEDERAGTVENVVDYWREATGTVTDVITLKFEATTRGPAGDAIKIEFRGENLEKLKKVAEDSAAWFYQFDGVYDLYNNLRPGKPELKMSLKDGATALGMNATMIARQLRTAFQGETASEIQVGTKSYEVDVRLNAKDKNSVADVERFKLISPSGHQIPLLSVVDIETGRGYSIISHVDGLRTVTLYGNVNRQTANVQQLINKYKNDFLPSVYKNNGDIKVIIKGESYRSAKTGGSMAQSMLIGLIGIFVLLSFQFKSYLEPIIVMLAIPLSLIGVIWGHIFMGIPLTLPSILGFISLSGVVVNDSILLVEFIKLRKKEGLPVIASVCQASRERFRAVLLTSITTVIGLLPLLTETSLHAKVLIPIATSIAFGLVASTLLVLFVIPSFYVILNDFGWIKTHEVA